MKEFRLPRWTIPLALLLICITGYGLLIRWLGFYQDDWYQIWFGRAFGANVFVDYYSYERPFIAGLYLLTTPFIGSNPTNWQIFALFTRWLAVLSLWWSLGIVWRNRLATVTWIAILFALYPGFRQQWASVIYSHYFLQFAIQMASIGLMVLAVRKPDRFWLFTVLALSGALVGLFSSEYFFGLELLRPVFLWLVIKEDKSVPARLRWRRFFLVWLPYLSILAGFLVWRIFIFEFPTYQPVYAKSPQAGLLSLIWGLAKTIANDIFETGLFAWAYPIKVYLAASLKQPAVLFALALSLVSAGLIAVYLWFIRPTNIERSNLDNSNQGRTAQSQFAYTLIGIGLFALLASGWPFWFVDLQVNLELSGGSRLTLPFMLGASILIVGLIELIFRRRIYQIICVAVLSGLAIGHHFLDANTYRQVHQIQAGFFQQLAWRAPGIQPHTIVLTDAFNDLPMSGDNSLTAALNWVYQPNPPYSLDYLFAHELTSLVPGTSIQKSFRTTKFTGSTSDVLVIYAPLGSCLRVIDPEADIHRPIGMTKEVKDAMPLSNLSRIIPDPAAPASLPGEVFKIHLPENSWCYYYEKAELARQQKDWEAIVRLADQAFKTKSKIDNTWELSPFIEGYALTGQIDEAHQLTEQARLASPEGKSLTHTLICATWTRIGQESSGDPHFMGTVDQILQEYNCK